LDLVLSEALEIDDFDFIRARLDNFIQLVVAEFLVLVYVELRVLLFNVTGVALSVLEELKPSDSHLLVRADFLWWYVDYSVGLQLLAVYIIGLGQH